MLHNVFLSFQDNDHVEIQEQLFIGVQNTFTIEFWAKPEVTHGIVKQSRKGITDIKNQRFVVLPVFGAYDNGDASRAGVGISMGTNGVSIYEHTTNYLPATLVLKTPLNDWTHIALVYINKTPLLFINGKFVRKGLTSIKKNVVPSGVFGGSPSFGSYVGKLREVRIWSTARTKSEIRINMRKELTGGEFGLFGYWKLNEGDGVIVHDSTKNKKDGLIKGATWNILQKNDHNNRSINILFTYYVPSGGIETLNRQRFYALNKHGINCHFLYTREGTGLQNKIDALTFITNSDNEIKDIIDKGNYKAIVVCSDHNLLKKIRSFGYTGSLIYENQGAGKDIKYADHFFRNQAHSMINEYSDAVLYPVTPHLIQAFNTYFPNKKKFCFHNCFNSKEFHYQVHSKKNRPIIGWVGRVEENKNWKDFLLIGARLIRENPSIQLWMFEDNTLSTKDERLAFEKKIDDLNLRNHLTIYANQPHSRMAEYFSMIGDSGGFLCSTSKVEGFGYAVLEALVCRCPVLSTDSEGVRSFVQHNITGKFFELGNINQATQEAKELMSNVQLRELIRQNGVKHIEVHFSPETYAKNFLNMISDLGSLKK